MKHTDSSLIEKLKAAADILWPHNHVYIAGSRSDNDPGCPRRDSDIDIFVFIDIRIKCDGSTITDAFARKDDEASSSLSLVVNAKTDVFLVGNEFRSLMVGTMEEIHAPS